jgi:uncharacterized protein (DUF934 family)
MGTLIRRADMQRLRSLECALASAAKADADEAEARKAEVGEVLRIEPADDPARIASRLGAVSRVEVNFPSFADGRGYSIARLLRERHGYRGELRAVGDVQRDQLFYLARCGFDAFLLRDDEDAQASLAALHDFSEAYQASVERPLPLFRRR